MSKKHLLPLILVFMALGLLGFMLFQNLDGLSILNPQGEVADKQRSLIYFTVALSLIVVLPVFFMTFWFPWKYREGNSKAKYTPDWDHHPVAETIWWGVPLVIISILAVVTYQSSHALDPFKAIPSTKQPLTIQVVALDWKWLFIYPEQQIASVNYVKFPQKTPIKFEITADAPMNSFWIPQLGSQIYAMSGMSTHLNLMADHTGVYRGSSANISGRGFAGMHFDAVSSNDEEFNNWVVAVKASRNPLTTQEYSRLASPSQNNPPTHYSIVDQHLYDTIVMKYMAGYTPETR